MMRFEDAKAFLRRKMEERRERKVERDRQKAMRRPHDSRFWLLSIPAMATMCAAFVEIYWATLFCIEATGSLDGSWSTSLGSQQAAAGAWHFVFDIRNMFVLIGLVAATIPIVMWSMVWLPVQMKARGHGRWRRLTMICAGLLANALVIMSGTVVMNSNRQDQVRAGLASEQAAQQNIAGRRATAEAIKAELDDIAVPQSVRPTYQQQACRVGATAWQTRVTTAQAQGDYQFPAIQRALADASHCDDLRRQYREALAFVYSAPVAAETQVNVRDDVGVGLNTFAQYATVYRPPFVALICTIIGIFGAWWWVGLSEAMDRHNVSLSGWADEAHRIEDQRAEDPIAAEPMKPAREVVTDAETGEELVKVKPHWRKLKKGKPQRVEVTPEPLPDEVGVPPELDNRDSELRAASAEEQKSAESNPGDEGNRTEPEPVVSAEPVDQQPELSLEDEASLNALAEPPIDDSDASEQHDQSGGDDDEGGHLATGPENVAGDEQADEPNDLEPPIEHHETPITQEDRLLAPPESVAAE